MKEIYLKDLKQSIIFNTKYTSPQMSENKVIYIDNSHRFLHLPFVNSLLHANTKLSALYWLSNSPENLSGTWV